MYSEKIQQIIDQKPAEIEVFTAKDIASDQEVRWCPGCGDYSILKQVQTVVPKLGHRKEDIVFISGIGCSSRFPYYMDTYGMHSIHGRATAIATGLKMARPDLSVWVITGDGDSLSIGAGHTIHMLRRNPNLNVLLFNNQIYGLTKGQYSPTSELGKVTKSTPMGSLDHPFNPLALALGADASFIARSLDRDPKHLQEMLIRADKHVGTSFLEIYQNCNVFNDGAFFTFTEKETKSDHVLFLEHGQPMVFGKDRSKGIRLKDNIPTAFDFEADGLGINDCLIHDETNSVLAGILTRFSDMPDMPRPVGVLYVCERPSYETMTNDQINQAIELKGKGNLDALIAGKDVWEVV
jgi:2-oxoglutarate ferredoxin oxidoreductase subunit beta